MNSSLSERASSKADPRVRRTESPGNAKIAIKACEVLVALAGLAWVGIHAGPAAMAGSALPTAPSASVPLRATDSGPVAPPGVIVPPVSAVNGEEKPLEKGRTTDGKVILNQASETDLVSLPGVGPKRAQGILALRQRLGRFHNLQELLRVKGIGRKSLERLRPQLLLDAADHSPLEQSALETDGFQCTLFGFYQVTYSNLRLFKTQVAVGSVGCTTAVLPSPLGLLRPVRLAALRRLRRLVPESRLPRHRDRSGAFPPPIRAGPRRDR